MIKFVRLQVCKLICCLSLLFETCMPSLEVCTSTFVCCLVSYEDVGPHMTDIANLFSKRNLTENLFVKFPICFIYTI